MAKYLVFLEEGVYIDLPDDVEVESDKFWHLLEPEARIRFLNLLETRVCHVSYEKLEGE